MNSVEKLLINLLVSNSSISSSLNSNAACAWEDLLQWKFNHLKDFKKAAVNKLLGNEISLARLIRYDNVHFHKFTWHEFMHTSDTPPIPYAIFLTSHYYVIPSYFSVNLWRFGYLYGLHDAIFGRQYFTGETKLLIDIVKLSHRRIKF